MDFASGWNVGKIIETLNSSVHYSIMMTLESSKLIMREIFNDSNVVWLYIYIILMAGGCFILEAMHYDMNPSLLEQGSTNI